ncbi:MAG: SBBP repeat-containing protein [Flavobacteriales bacterium]
MNFSTLRVVLLLAPLMGRHPTTAQFFAGAAQMGGPEAEVMNDLEEDVFGNLFATGSFRATADFDPGPDVYSVTGTGLGNVDNVFVAKYDSSMSPLWVAVMGGGTWLDHGAVVAPGPNGESVTLGQFQDSGDFDPGPGVTILTAVDASDVFCVKLDASGGLVWAVQFGDTAYDIPYDLAVDGSGNVLLGGRFIDTMDVDPGPDIQLMPPVAGSQGLLIKLNPQGELLWAVHMGYSVDQILPAPGGEILVRGSIATSMDADPGAGVVTLDQADGDNYLIRLDSGGNLISAGQFGRTINGWGTVPVDMAVDPVGNIVLAGYFFGIVDVDPGPGAHLLTESGPTGQPDMFVAKLDPAGELIWAFSCGAAGVEQALDVTLTLQGPILVSGSYYDSPVDLDPGPGVVSTTVFGEADIFLLAIDPDGTFLGASWIGGSGGDWLNGTIQRSNGALLGYGIFEGTMDFDPGPGEFLLTSEGQIDIFIAHFIYDTTGLVDLVPSSPVVRIHPNPATECVHITGEGVEHLDLKVYDALGNIRQVPVKYRGRDEVVLDVTETPPGIFHVVGTSTAPVLSGKFIVTR